MTIAGNGIQQIESHITEEQIIIGSYELVIAWEVSSYLFFRYRKNQKVKGQGHKVKLNWAQKHQLYAENVIGVSQVDGRPPVLTATTQSNGNGQTLTTHRIQTP